MTSDTLQKLKIDITSDYLCPFCLLGMRQLELAIAKYRERDPNLEIEIRKHPYQLNGLLTEAPVSRHEWGVAKFGAERWETVTASLGAKFRAVGINATSNGLLASSHLAHRLTEYAWKVDPSVQAPLSMDIYALHHIKGMHTSNKHALAGIATKHGLFESEAEALEWLNGNDCDCETKQAYQRAQRTGITGVPFFVFQDKYAASGAMGVEEFVKIIAEIVSREGSSSPPRSFPASDDQCIAHNDKGVPVCGTK